ncbi:MAG: CPBP family intramembrane glutamic endopeptidase [Elusimicrobiota bacterium]
MALFVIALGLYYAYYYGVIYAYRYVTRGLLNPYAKNTEFLRTQLTVWYLALALVNPFYEELIVRAYVISKMEYLTGKVSVAVAASLLLQAAYHLYQGIFAGLGLCLIFLVFSVYYVRSRRIMPVILAHLYLDLNAMLQSALF